VLAAQGTLGCSRQAGPVPLVYNADQAHGRMKGTGDPKPPTVFHLRSGLGSNGEAQPALFAGPANQDTAHCQTILLRNAVAKGRGHELPLNHRSVGRLDVVWADTLR
jgi:hypothetical protein